jgi:hypothetical protein
MIFFLFASIPLTFLFLVSCCHADALGRRGFWIPVVQGVFTYLPAVLLFLIFRGSSEAVYTTARLYFFHFYHDYFLWLLLGTLGYFLIHGFPRYTDEGGLDLFGFFTGFFTAVNLFELIFRTGNFTPYTLFLLPLSRISLVILATMLITKGFSFDGFQQWALFGAAVLTALLPAFSALLYEIHFPVLAWLVTFILILGAGGVYLFSNRSYRYRINPFQRNRER